MIIPLFNLSLVSFTYQNCIVYYGVISIQSAITPQSERRSVKRENAINDSDRCYKTTRTIQIPERDVQSNQESIQNDELAIENYKKQGNRLAPRDDSFQR